MGHCLQLLLGKGRDYGRKLVREEAREAYRMLGETMGLMNT